MNGSAKTFSVNPEAKKLHKATLDRLFHHLVAKLLHIYWCTRQDIQTAVSLLCTRVRAPDKANYKKLTRVSIT